MALTFRIGNADFSSWVNDRTYAVDYERQSGENAGFMLDGTEWLDTITVKAVITWDLNSITAERLATVLRVALQDYVQVTYFDTLTNADRTATFIPTISGQNYAFPRHGLNYFRDGVQLTLRERKGRTVGSWLS